MYYSLKAFIAAMLSDCCRCDSDDDDGIGAVECIRVIDCDN